MNKDYNNLINKTKDIYGIVIKEAKYLNKDFKFVYDSSLTDDESLNMFVLKYLINKDVKDINSYLLNDVPTFKISLVNDFNDCEKLLYSGFCLIYVDNKMYSFFMKKNIDRSISESTLDPNITGPKDAFNENIDTNIGLINKRIKSFDLKSKTYVLGRYTKSNVVVLYMDTLCNKDTLDDIDKRLCNIDIDGIIDGHYVEELLIPEKSSFPTVVKTEKPDYAVNSLLNGKIVILTENSPNCLILPTLFIDFFHVPEDYYQKSINVTITRMIRLLAFTIAIILPALYIGITTYNPEIMPPTLFLVFAEQRSNIAFPAIVEALIMILAFEVIKESDTRLPNQVGSALSIVGGLVLGDAAVKAGLVSPIMIIVIALSSISGLMFSNMDMINAVRLQRIVFIFFASLLGVVGIYIYFIILVIKLSSINTFSKPFMYPFSPLYLFKSDVIKRNSIDTLKRDELFSNNIKKYKELS